MVGWDDVRVVLEAQRAGTLAGAAIALGVDATTVGRRIAAIEREIGEPLFHRGPRGLVLSQSGREVVAAAEGMERLALGLESAVSPSSRAEGTVTLTTSEAFARTILVPALAPLRVRHPGIDLVLITSNRPVDLARGEADLALRLLKPGAGSLLARRLGQLEIAPYASIDYLARRPPPAPGLSGHDVIGYDRELRGKPEQRWLEKNARDARVTFRSDSIPALVAAAVAGFGVVLVPRRLGDSEPTLRRIDTLPDVPPKSVWIVCRRSALRVPRVRAVHDFLVGERARLVGLSR